MKKIEILLLLNDARQKINIKKQPLIFYDRRLLLLTVNCY